VLFANFPNVSEGRASGSRFRCARPAPRAGQLLTARQGLRLCPHRPKSASVLVEAAITSPPMANHRGVAMVNEAAISANPRVIRESGGDARPSRGRHPGAVRLDPGRSPRSGLYLHRPHDPPGRGRRAADTPNEITLTSCRGAHHHFVFLRPSRTQYAPMPVARFRWWCGLRCRHADSDHDRAPFVGIGIAGMDVGRFQCARCRAGRSRRRWTSTPSCLIRPAPSRRQPAATAFRPGVA